MVSILPSIVHGRNNLPLQLLECIESFKNEVKQKIHRTRERTLANEEFLARVGRNLADTHFSNRNARALKESCSA
jgi:hypothetical protein